MRDINEILAKKTVALQPSGIRKFFDIVRTMEGAISLGVGEPDFDTPWPIREEGIYSLERGRTFYTSNAGLNELREEIARYIQRRFGVSYEPLSEITVTVGGSEGIDLACRALLKRHTDGIPGRLIDLIAVFALIAGTATTFAVSAPLLSGAISAIFSVKDSTALTIAILLFICVVYTVCAYFGIHGISIMAASCTWLFFALLLYVLFLGGMPRYILETGLSSIGNVAQNFISLCTYTDPLRKTGFAQNTTIFYWAYWMVWCVATPFFIGSISRGRTIREVILGGYAAGLLGTWVSFIVLGNYGLGLQMFGKVDLLGMYAESGNLYETILTILRTLPGYRFVLILLVLAMIAFYATSFDSIAVVASAYSYREMSSDEEPDRRLKLFWSILLILLPIALLFSESSMANLQTVSIIAAFPIGFIMILILASFFRDASDYLKEQEQERNEKER